MTGKKEIETAFQEIELTISGWYKHEGFDENDYLHDDLKIIKHELALLDAAIFYIARTTMKDKTWNEIREALEKCIVKIDKLDF